MNALVTIAVGNKAQQMYRIAKPYFLDYAKKIGCHFICIKDPKIQIYAHNLEKFQMYELFDKYERILYLDVDILVHPKCPNLFDIVYEDKIGAVYDNSKNAKNAKNRCTEIIKAHTSLGKIPGWDTEYINSGVILCSKKHREIYSNPELRRKLVSSYNDQTLINYNIQKFGFKIQRLDARFNGMEITGYSSRSKNPKHNNVNNKTHAYIMHFANEGDKYKQMALVSDLLKKEYNLPYKSADVKNKHPIKHFTVQPKPKRVYKPQTKAKPKTFKQCIEIPDYIPASNELTIVDFAELGWSMYNAGYGNWLKKHKHVKLSVILRDPAREVMYRTCADNFYKMPDLWYKKYGQFPSDGNHLFDPKSNKRIRNWTELLSPIRKAYPHLKIIEKYSKFNNQRIMKPYQHSAEMEQLYKELIGEYKCIIVFPRFRTSKFACRNIPKSEWQYIVDYLCGSFPKLKVVSIGASNQSLQLNGHNNFIDLTQYDDNKTLDLLVMMCNTKKAVITVGNQSAPPKIALLCNCPSYMFGNERKRHQYEENWGDAPCGFYDVPIINNCYQISNVNLMCSDIVKFIRSIL